VGGGKDADNGVENMRTTIPRKKLKKPATALGSVLAMFILVATGHTARAYENILPLAGTWQFRLDPEDIGIEKKWFAEKLDDSVTLPGTTDTNQKGVFKDERAVDRLSRVWLWKGPAWYQRALRLRYGQGVGRPGLLHEQHAGHDDARRPCERTQIETARQEASTWIGKAMAKAVIDLKPTQNIGRSNKATTGDKSHE